MKIPQDVLINNIAWFLRRFPAFPIAGSGDYPIQPVFVDDLAQLAVNAGAGSKDVVLDAVGPETFTFEEMVRLIARRVGSRARLIHVRPSVALLAARMAGWLVRDVVLTRDEIDGLMAGHLVSADPPTASTRFTEWLEAEGATLERRFCLANSNGLGLWNRLFQLSVDVRYRRYLQKVCKQSGGVPSL